MKQDIAEKTAVFLVKNGAKAQDVYFGWMEIFHAMVKIELGRKGKLNETEGGISVSATEFAHPTFSINLHDHDGDVYCEGIYLHYGDTIIKVASTMCGFRAHAMSLINMAEEISEGME